MFYEFDKNDIHKDHTYIFDTCSLDEEHYYELNGKEYVSNRGETGETRSLFLTNVEFDKRFESPKSLFMRTNPETGEYENYRESYLGRDLLEAHDKFDRLKYIYENVHKEDPRYKSFYFYEFLKYGLSENCLIHKL